jgi:ABC-type taurine transport system ATPase subunit
MRTTFYNSRGEEVFNPRLIALDYLLSIRFASDFLAFFPWDQIIHTRSGVIKTFGICKLVRVQRLNQILQKMDLKDERKAMIQIF